MVEWNRWLRKEVFKLGGDSFSFFGAFHALPLHFSDVTFKSFSIANKGKTRTTLYDNAAMRQYVFRVEEG